MKTTRHSLFVLRDCIIAHFVILFALRVTSFAQVYEKVFSFTAAQAESGPADSNKGVGPYANLIQTTDGNFYGVTDSGGSFYNGTIFKIAANGAISNLVEFSGNGSVNKGSNPRASLFKANDGNFLGTTAGGGPNNHGTVFKMTSTGVITTIVEFSGNGAQNKGSNPLGQLIQGSDGMIYGTTGAGGASNCGTVFRMTLSGTLVTLAEFTSNGAVNKGANPYAGLIQASDGNFYGTTYNGGQQNYGTIFRMTPQGVITTLVSFTDTNGSHPHGRIIQGSDGNFYGTTEQGGALGAGTVYKMSPAGSLVTLVSFSGNEATNRGSQPECELLENVDGHLYGTTNNGGLYNKGTVFKLTKDGGLTTLFDFDSNAVTNNGSYPIAGVIRASDGYLYGSNSRGGNYGSGTIFKLSAGGMLSTVATFSGNGGGEIGSEPSGGVIDDSSGSLFGTTYLGGGLNGNGTVYKISPDGKLTNLKIFSAELVGSIGSDPLSGLVKDATGSLYGTTSSRGPFFRGTIFKISPTGTLTTAVAFTGIDGENKGSYPQSDLAVASDGNVYGTTYQGGANDFGTIFKLDTAGTLTTLVEFTGNGTSNKGRYPRCTLIQGSDGSFYGTTGSGGTNDNGTIFKMTPAGVLTTLVSFSGLGSSNRGGAPRGKLFQATDGTFYGTTEGGGASGKGTIFKMTAGGNLTTLIEFTGNGASNKGAYPYAGVVEGLDGNLYGTTFRGGANDNGTIFRMTPSGVLTTLLEFAEDGSPKAGLLRAGDGNLYGTTTGPHGTVFRLVFAGPPLVHATSNFLPGTTSAVVEAKVNARGSATSVTVEFGTDGVSFPTSFAVAGNMTGFQSTLVGTTLSELPSGATFYFRFRATSGAGTTVSPVASFSTLAEPMVATNSASSILTTSATFNATVNARNFDSTAVFEWGTDGNSFPNEVPAVPGTVTGNTPVAVSAAVAGLTKGTTYFFRVRATNVAGTVTSGTQSFSTLTEPTASVVSAFGLNTTAARVTGMVNGQGSVTDVSFEYGTDGNSFPNSVDATPSVVPGTGNVAVEAVLPNLLQGTTYHYRIRATSLGGITVSESETFDLGVLSGFDRVFPSVLDPRSGAQVFLTVNLAPVGLSGAGWRFVGEQDWRVPGLPVGGLATGNRQIEFRPVPGYLHPLREPVSITSGAAATVVEREYFSGAGVATASLSVTLLPSSLGAAAQWRLLGEGDAAWRASGASIGELAAGVYLVECKEVDGYATPRPRSVTIGSGEAKTATATYFLADADVGAQPSVVGFDAVTSASPSPYTHVGQLRSDSGAGTGFVVRQRVVATAAHVVFDDGTLSAATGLQWLFQRERGTYEPVPQIPRGSYILSGYSAQRIADGTPGTSSAAAQNLDVASVWFYEQDAGRGGSGGYLASDSTDNEWLLSSRLKTIVGYPLDDIALLNQGRMHATPPMNVTFTHANGRVYLTDDITSRGGNSGGPVMVQYDDGRYFPAAVYLGGTTQTRVRAIDSHVITLFDSAEESSNTGENSTNGGSSQVNNSQNTTPAGALLVTIEPEAARSAGAGWKTGTGAFLQSGTSRGFLSAGDYTVTFKSIEGFQTPSSRSVSITGGNTTAISVTYPPALPPVITGPAVKRAVRGQLLSFSIAADNAPTSFSVSGLVGTGLTLDTTSGALTGTPQTNGTFTLNATAQNNTGTSAPFEITLIVADPGTLIVQSDPTRGSVIVKPNFPGNILPQGTPVTLTAKAKEPDFLFGGWQFSGLANPQPDSNTPTATFPMTESVLAVANFIPNPYLSRMGTYQGLLISTAGADGIASLKLGKLGTFTMKLMLAGKPYSLAGRLDTSGHFTGEIKRPRLTPIPVSLQLDLAAQQPRLTGALTVDNANIILDAARITYGKKNPAPAAGKYTFALPPDPAQNNAAIYPAGHGYLLASVKSTGTMNAWGLLGDGTPFSAAGTLGTDNVWPIHVRPYGSKGIVVGFITFTQHTAPLIDEANGTLRWMKPITTKGLYQSGFSGSIAALGSRWAPPVKGSAALDITNWNLAIGNGVLVPPLTGTATLSTANVFTLTGASGTKLTLASKTGLISGSFAGANGKPVKFKGALLQSQRIGRGVFALPDKTGPVTLGTL